MSDVDPTLEKRFKAATVELQALIQRRKSSWRLTSVMDFDDVSSIVLAHIWEVWDQYDPAQPLDRWANTVIRRRIQNLLRDNLYKNSRPCTAANPYGANCSFNTGENRCSWTKSGIQDSSCKFFARWFAKKQSKLAISNPVFIEDHVNESYSKFDDSLDIENAKKIIDENIQRRLTKEEYEIYRLLHIEHLDKKEAAARMGYEKNDMTAYMRIRTASIRIKEVGKQILSEQAFIR